MGAERPVRTQLLEERLVAFRDGEGRLGLLYGLCPHARGDLFYSTIDNEGIRCNYHGWKFDVHGICLETPMHPDGFGIDALAFPVAEHAGLIWGYLGAEEPPPLPDIAVMHNAQTERRTRPWLDTVVSELLSSTGSGVIVERLDGQIRIESHGSSTASFALPGIVTHSARVRPTLILPASEKATALVGSAGDPATDEGDVASDVRDAIEHLLRQAIAGTL